MRLNLTQINEKPWLCGIINNARDPRYFSISCRSEASLLGSKTVHLGNQGRARPFRGGVARSVRLLGRSKSGRQIRPQRLIATQTNTNATHVTPCNAGGATRIRSARPLAQGSNDLARTQRAAAGRRPWEAGGVIQPDRRKFRSRRSLPKMVSR